MSGESLKVAAVQLAVEAGAIEDNLAHHRQALEQAKALGADLVLFPELSLTGYELEQAGALAMECDHPVIGRLSEWAQELELLVISGAFIWPAKAGLSELAQQQQVKPCISGILSFPDGNTRLYHKQNLHPGEERYVRAGEQDCIFDYHGVRIALAICADIAQPAHGAAARKAGADLYLASVLISAAGLAADSALLQSQAGEHGMVVLMANHCGWTGGWQGAGSSGGWVGEDALAELLSADQPALFMVELQQQRVADVLHYDL